jgi:hypothetical protein
VRALIYKFIISRGEYYFIINPIIIDMAMLSKVPITRYSVLISGRSFSLNLIMPFAATNKPIAEY